MWGRNGAVALFAALAVSAGTARAHELSCEKKVNGTGYFEITSYPATLNYKLTVFNEHPTGKLNKDVRLNAVMQPGGVTDCGNAQNCLKVCPKEIPLTDSIAYLYRETTWYGLLGWLKK